MTSSAGAKLPPLLVETVEQLSHNSLAGAGALSWVLYDTILSFPQEVEYIWRAPWSLPKALYYASRYYGLFNLIITNSVLFSLDVTPEFCEGYKWFQAFSGAVVFVTTVNLLLLLRIHALYENSRPRALLFFLAFAYIVDLGAEIAVTYLTINGVHSMSKMHLPLRGCLYSPPKGHINLYSWIPVLILSAVYFVLALWKFILFLRDETETFGFSFVRKEREPLGMMPILGMFVRDGTLAFVMLFVIMLLNTLFTTISRTALAAVAIPWLLATYTVAGSRLILNLRSPHKAAPSRTLVASDIEMRPRRTPALVYKAPDDGDPDGQGTWSAFSNVRVFESTESSSS